MEFIGSYWFVWLFFVGLSSLFHSFHKHELRNGGGVPTWVYYAVKAVLYASVILTALACTVKLLRLVVH